MRNQTFCFHLLCLTASWLFCGLVGCNPDSEAPPPVLDPCASDSATAIDMRSLTSGYRGEVAPIRENLAVEGYVASSDEAGNIFGSVYLQDRPENPDFGIELRTDLLDAYTRFPVGSKVRINLENLYLGAVGDGWALGSVRELFGTAVLDRIPAATTLDHLSLVCDEELYVVEPRAVRLAELAPGMVHTLVRLLDVEVAPEFRALPFAEPQESTEVILEGCEGGQIVLPNSGYSEFQALPLPHGSGTATGILLGGQKGYQLLLRTAADLDLESAGCAERFPPERSDRIFISEIADPDNEPGARFLELFNSGTDPVDLKGWRLQRYTNANPEAGADFELDGFRISGGGTLVFTANPALFETVYGQAPDGVLRSNGPADSNGDDNILLIDPFGEVTDAFGIPGEDGSGTAHEFEDGKALRKKDIIRASPEFRPQEWLIYNDTGDAGTIRQPMQAPDDYSPGIHPDPGGS